jgi:hypothetical protein
MGANRREHLPALAMQKAVGSSPIIRCERTCKSAARLR